MFLFAQSQEEWKSKQTLLQRKCDPGNLSSCSFPVDRRYLYINIFALSITSLFLLGFHI
jgi:hypothetical protein